MDVGLANQLLSLVLPFSYSVLLHIFQGDTKNEKSDFNLLVGESGIESCYIGKRPLSESTDGYKFRLS